jgi:hypothetical protein
MEGTQSFLSSIAGCGLVRCTPTLLKGAPMISTQQLQVNAVRAYSAFVQDQPSTPDTEPKKALLLMVLDSYGNDLQRKIERREGSLEYLMETLKPAIRAAGELMEIILINEPIAMLGWWQGAEPKNQVQMVYGMMAETAFELGMSIMEIESQFPHLKFLFEWEKETFTESVNRREAERN